MEGMERSLMPGVLCSGPPVEGALRLTCVSCGFCYDNLLSKLGALGAILNHDLYN